MYLLICFRGFGIASSLITRRFCSAFADCIESDSLITSLPGQRAGSSTSSAATSTPSVGQLSRVLKCTRRLVNLFLPRRAREMLTIMAMLTTNVAMNGPTEYTKRFKNFQWGAIPGDPSTFNSHAPICRRCNNQQIMLTNTGML